MVSCPRSVIAPTAAAGPLSAPKLISTWMKVSATVSRMASARSRDGRLLVSRSTVTVAPPAGQLWGRLPCAASQLDHVHRSFCLDIAVYRPLDCLYTDRCVY